MSLSLQGVVSVMQLLCSHITRWSNTQSGFTPGRGVYVWGGIWTFFSCWSHQRVGVSSVVGMDKKIVSLQMCIRVKGLCACVLSKASVYVLGVCVCACHFIGLPLFKSVTEKAWHWMCDRDGEGERNREKERERVGEGGRECWHVSWPGAISFFSRSFGSSSAKWELRFLGSSRLVIIIIVTAKAQA